MSMSGTRLGDAIVTAFQSINPGMTTAQINQLKSAWEAVGTAIVDEITNHAQVAVNVTSVSGVTSGGGTSGPGTGTGTVS
jgi:hypothetical protein